ncbi:MAG: hypothetical protein ACJ75J_08910 [Cytophagaceae bacterium]
MNTISSSIRPIAFVYFILAISIAIPILSVLYAVSIYYIPVAIVRPLMPLLFAALAGGIIERYVIAWSKLDNVRLIFLFCLVAGIVLYILSWPVWLSLVNERGSFSVSGIIDMIADPYSTFDYILKINQRGAWSFSGMTVSGIALSIIWLLELIIICGVPLLVLKTRGKLKAANNF